ncbi:MAG: hypothetical protein LBM69_07265 [Lachnospiraceae bacterium]|jgi:hypothetical protein|nr:hypothetical protein [Lachnospiraceae bacterium]
MKKYEDYKYIMQDTHTIFIGANYSAQELIEDEEVPFKVRLIFEKYLYTEDTKDQTLADYFYGCKDKTLLYRVYKQLKTKIRISYKQNKVTLSRKLQTTYENKLIPLEELMKISDEDKIAQELTIQEIAISKLAMLSF